MSARAIMFQGTGSDVGKSLIVAGLARALTLRGLKVAPFKPQNMSNNAAVTTDGGEIGRAQALQARAARRPMTVHMNPVLLKPQSEIGSQVVVQGRVIGNAKASAYQAMKPQLMNTVLESFHHLAADADIVLVEGAGSASEINLRAGDIANMGFAQAVQIPVVLIGDIDRGGVIASLVGTQAVIAPADAARIAGFLVNKFRGDPALFASGINEIAQRTGWTSLGLIPHFSDARRLPAEDALGLAERGSSEGRRPKVVILAYPRISNFDEFDPLRLEDGIDLQFLRPGTPIPGDASIVILPGSKATIADLSALRDAGWDIDLIAHLRRGGRVLGICGGYQMLGRMISDPDGHEGASGSVTGLGLLDVETTLTDDKALREVQGTLMDGQLSFHGYEMHIGRTEGLATQRPFLTFSDGRRDGAITADGLVAGCYVHGLFADDGLRSHWLRGLGSTTSGLVYETDVDTTLDAFAAHLERYVDVDRILALASKPAPPVATTGS
ncbi:cobyric acid synthase [Bradyrhizobium sp. HKCCYLRH2060]|uniref:cobyric acid synthase n=1 Tax=Bradyrhizobium TaxID=374 RepID=UPI002916F9DD|nr:cobyric acid synthase [Bradyrhizobium sp. SZCCHNR3003]